jgi:hypothetical protein
MAPFEPPIFGKLNEKLQVLALLHVNIRYICAFILPTQPIQRWSSVAPCGGLAKKTLLTRGSPTYLKPICSQHEKLNADE